MNRSERLLRATGAACLAAVLRLAVPAAATAAGDAPAPAAGPAYVAEVDAWHAQRVERLRSETGWLTLVGLDELDPATVNDVGSAPEALVRLIDKAPARVGQLACAGGQWTFTVADGVAVTTGDPAQPVTTLALKTDREGAPTALDCGTLQFFVIERDGRFFLRVKDREAEVRRHFTGIDRYPVNERWRLIARLEPGPATVKVPNVLGQATDTPSPGVLVFTVDGRECRLTPTGGPGEELFLVFGDATNGKGTYGGGRFLSAAAPGPDGVVTLDFNQAYNPPCVFTPYATCPLPGKDNTLPVAIEAGEMVWGDH